MLNIKKNAVKREIRSNLALAINVYIPDINFH